MSYGPVYGPVNVVPFSFDLSSLVRRSVASLYSNLVTRPTGRALRLGIESQIGEVGSCCVSILDFTEVIVLDYSCADEAVAKLIQRYMQADRPADVYFIARGVAEQHCGPIETVLLRHGLALVAQRNGVGFTLLGTTTGREQAIWVALERAGFASLPELARATDHTEADARELLDGLARQRVVLPVDPPHAYYALSALLVA